MYWSTSGASNIVVTMDTMGSHMRSKNCRVLPDEIDSDHIAVLWEYEIKKSEREQVISRKLFYTTKKADWDMYTD